MAAKADLPRRIAFEVLLRFDKGGADRLKADSLVADALARNPAALSEQDRGFVYALVMGTLRHWLRLDEWIKRLTGKHLKQMTPQVRVLLRLGLFQLYGLNQVPAYAAINTTVDLAKGQKQSPRTIKFINAVLREAQRVLEADGFAIPPVETDLPDHLLWAYGWPESFTRMLQNQYGPQAILDMAEQSQSPSGLSIRVNTLKINPAAYLETLKVAGLEAKSLAELPAEPAEGIRLADFSGSPRKLPGFEQGLCYVQDASSMWVSHLLKPQPGESVLDLCAAPGSKTTHMAALMQNEGAITAIDPKPERLALLTENVQRLGITNIHALQADGLTFDPAEQLYDKVLVDAPCSGSGTLRRHTEILLHLKKLNLDAYVKTQWALLQKGFECLRPGGAMIYSTCSVLRAENHDVVAKLLASYPNATLESEEQRLINENADGFYAARILKTA